MTAFLVAYDLVGSTSEGDYRELISAIEKLKGVRMQKSVWLVSATGTAVGLRNHLLPYLHQKKDRLMVIDLPAGTGWAGHWNLKGTTEWMEKFVGPSH